MRFLASDVIDQKFRGEEPGALTRFIFSAASLDDEVFARSYVTWRSQIIFSAGEWMPGRMTKLPQPDPFNLIIMRTTRENARRISIN